MAHGGPDWGIGVPVSTIYGLDDMGELVVRLGSIDTFDRRGNVVFLSSFEDSLNPFISSKTGANASVSITNAGSRNGASSCELRPGDVIGDYALLQHYSPFPVSSKLGVEVSFATVHTDAIFAVENELDDTAERHYPRIYYDWDSDELSYYDSAGAPQVFASGLKLKAYERIFHTIKVVFDLAKKEYVRVILDNVEYDLSGKKYQTPATTGSAYWYQEMYAEAKVADGTWVYIDDLIVTQNEP